jgi:hypothetical protein
MNVTLVLVGGRLRAAWVRLSRRPLLRSIAMIKSGVAVAALGGLVLLGYFYASNRAPITRTEKVKQAALDVGDAVRDKSVAGLVDVRLKTKFGLDATRFLHAHYDEGRVVIYGLVPADFDPQALQAEASEVPGVDAVEVLVQTRPDFVVPLKPISGTPAPEPEPKTPPVSPAP